METYDRIKEITDANLIYCLVPLLISLALIELLFRRRFKTREALNIIRWVIIGYTTITLVHFVIGCIAAPQDYAIVQRATGPYWFAYWLMLLCATLLPFTLLMKRLGANFLYVAFIAVFMKIGFYFERFVIIVTSYHRDNTFGFEGNDFLPVLLLLCLQGFSLALLMLAFIALVERIKAKMNRR